MAGFQHSKNSRFNLDDSGGVLRKVTAYITGVDGLPGEQELSDISAFGDGGHKFIPGLKNAQFSVSFLFNSDPSSSGGFTDLILNIFGSTTTKTFEYYPDGQSSVAGIRSITGECWLTSAPIVSAVGESVAGTANFQVDGATTIN